MIGIAGSIQSYLKGLDLKIKADLKKQSSQQSDDVERSSLKSAIEQLNKFHEDNKQSGIVTKMMTGNKLSDAELAYLRQRNPGLYAKALIIKQDREAYEKEMKRCKTKEEVRRANLGKISALVHSFKAAEARNDAGAAAEASMKAKAVDDEHVRFMKSDDYARLPKDYEELKERRRKYKKSKSEALNVQVTGNMLKRQDYQFKAEIKKANIRSLSGKQPQHPHYDKKV